MLTENKLCFGFDCEDLQALPVRFLDLSVSSVSRDELYRALSAFLPQAAALASVPVSGFRVGAAALGASGRVYLGANQEFAGLPLNFTVHAEQAAVLNARASGEDRLLALAVSSAPCGYCRQFLIELRAPLDIVLNGQIEPLSFYLPCAFSLDSGGETFLPLLPLGGSVRFGTLGEMARCAARLSFSHYTGTKSGICLKCSSGAVFCGNLIESAAYNPTISAFQSAMTLRALFGSSNDEITEAYLAETGQTRFSPVFEAVMAKIAPRAEINVSEL